MAEVLDSGALPLWANGLVILTSIAVVGLGAHWVVEAAADIAKRLGTSELVIGLTLVALGTSAPEFAVTLLAAFDGKGDISVGNIVGSNIFNLGFILGGCALIRVISIPRPLLRRDGTVLGAATILILFLIGWDLRLDRLDGILLVILLLSYLAYMYRQHRLPADDDRDARTPQDNPPTLSTRRIAALLVLGLACVIGGSHFLVESATVVARGFGVSEWVIGVTIVAAGTSAPEFATSFSGVLKGRHALSAGNVIGSDIFNLLGVLGLAGILRPMEIDALARVSLVGLCGMVFLVLVFMRTGWRISRLEGLALVLIASARWGVDLLARAPTP